MTTIYIDVLIVLNIYVNFFLLRATARFTHVPLKTFRCIISSIVGSLFSLTILLPLSNFFWTLIIKLFAAAVITALAFGVRDRKIYIKLLIYFYIINFIFAGVVGFLYLSFSPSFMAFNNSYFYVDFSLLSLVVFTAVAYFAVTFLRRIMDKGSESSRKYSIHIRYKNNTIKLEALADTGNSLIDSFSGKPVIICPQKVFSFEEDLLLLTPEKLYSEYGFRMIPYSTIGNAGLIPIFNAEEIIIADEELHKTFKVDAFIGLINKDTSVIFNPKLLL